MNLFNLYAKLGLDTTEYEKGVEKSKEKTKEFTKDTEKKLNTVVASAWANIAGKIIDVAKSIAQAGLDTMTYVDSIGDMAGKWGFTTKEIQEFDYWATMSGTTIESLLTGMRGLVNQAEAGAPAFEKLGVKVKNNDGTFKGQRQLFLETLDALKKVENQTERNALQFEIFGRAGIELGQVINRDASELEALSQQAEDFGIILDEQTIEKAGDFNDVLDRLKLQGKSAFAGLITGAEDGQEAFDEYLDNLVEGVDRIAPKLEEAGSKILGAFLKGLGKKFVQNAEGALRITAGEGWIWGDKFWDKYDSFGEFLSSGFSDYATYGKDENPSPIFESQSNMQTSDNYSVEITMNSSGYTEEDARELAEEVIKQISTKKQAKGG